MFDTFIFLEPRLVNFVKKEDITNRIWEKGLAQEPQWIGKSFVWKDKWNNVKIRENSTNVEKILVENSTLVVF